MLTANTRWATRSCDLSPDDRRIVCGTVGDEVGGGLFIWGEPLKFQAAGSNPSDVRMMVIGHVRIRVAGTSTMALVAEKRDAHTSSITTSSVLSVRFSPDGTRIVSGSHDHSIKLWGGRLLPRDMLRDSALVRSC